ncbi:MAG: transposase [Spirochaetota bacterium]|nr:transposase [Spirochaetota bacterium]
MKLKQNLGDGQKLFIGIDVHLKTWHVTIRTKDIEIFCANIPGNWKSLKKLLDEYQEHELHVVYEAGYSGFWLHDNLLEVGIQCIVTPPSLIPKEYGSHVKTDRLDSKKLAQLLSKDLLREIYVPTEEELYHRQVVRRRR